MEDLELIKEFADYLTSKNFSYYTVSNYQKDVFDFKNFIDSEHLARNLTEVRRERIFYNYISSLNNQKYSARSVNRKISSLRTFYGFLVDKKLIDNNYAKEVSNIKTPKRLPNFIDEDYIIKMIDSIETKSDLGKRNKVIVELLFATGIRVSELCNLEVIQVDFYNDIIRIFGKGKKERIVYLYKELSDELNYYINFTRSNLIARSDNDDIPNVFINNKGTPLTTRGVRKILNSIIDKASLDLHVSPHMLRHSFATSMLNNGLDLRSVQKLLGHENLSTTQIYTHISKAKLEESYAKSFPHAKNKID